MHEIYVFSSAFTSHCDIVLSGHLPLLAPHTLCSVPCSPTGYRLGFGSPTRLVRLGLAGAMTVSGSVGIGGALPKGEVGSLTDVPAVSTGGSAVFFLRPREGEGLASAAPSDA